MPFRSTELPRRAVLAGLGALAGAPAWAAGDDDAALRRTLDTLDPNAPPAERLARLTGFREDRLSPGAVIDLDTVRAGLAIDARLAEARGAARYALQIERRLGEAVAPALAYQLLDDEVRALSRRADVLLRRLGFPRGTVGARFVAAFADPRFHYPDSSAGRDAAVADMNRTVATERARLAAEFARLPGLVGDVAARRMSPAEEAARKGGYRVLPTRTAPGGYYVDLADIARRPSWSLVSVARHELLPGHMVQLPLEALADPHPLRLEYLSAFPEGWAIYAEDRAGAHDSGWTELGRLHWLLFRALRGLLDTGIHHIGWPPARALQVLAEMQGIPAYFAPFDSDLDRTVREPGVRAAEALVWLRLRALRRASARRLPVQRFHALLLDHGRQRIGRLAAALEK